MCLWLCTIAQSYYYTNLHTSEYASCFRAHEHMVLDGFLSQDFDGVHASSIPLAHPGYQVLSDILLRLGLITNALTQCIS